MDAQGSNTSDRRRWWVVAGAAAIALVVGGVIGGLIAETTGRPRRAPASAAATSVADQTLPSVVTISARKGTTGGTGSGEVIRSDGYILTNNHVISVAADGGSIDVLFSDGVSAPATLIGRDPQADLAVIKVNETNLPVIPFGTSSSVVVGRTGGGAGRAARAVEHGDERHRQRPGPHASRCQATTVRPPCWCRRSRPMRPSTPATAAEP